MSKSMKTYKLNSNINPKTFNLGSYNPTCRAIIRSIYQLHKQNVECATGQQILEFAVDNNLWSTRQDREKFMTTFAYYLPKLRKEDEILVEVGTTSTENEIEFLEQ